jgi:hypothetical protein
MAAQAISSVAEAKRSEAAMGRWNALSLSGRRGDFARGEGPYLFFGPSHFHF